jgi:hypothetical protein
MSLQNEYIFDKQQQPYLQAVMQSLNARIINAVYYQYIGLAYNTSELSQNVNANVYFIGTNMILFNNDGANRYLTTFIIGGGIISKPGITASGNTSFYNDYIIPFNYMRHNIAGGLVTSVNTITIFIGYRIQI